MDKRTFIARVAAKTGQTKRATERTMDALFQTMAEVLDEGERVLVNNFGTFATKQRAARKARNPKTGEVIPLESMRTPVFRPCRVLKERISGENTGEIKNYEEEPK